jgi:hypothetical protein
MVRGSLPLALSFRLAPLRVAWSATVLLSLVVLLCAAPHAARSATFSATDADAIGKWTSDAKDPSKQYEVRAGTGPGQLQLISPAADKVPPILLRRAGPNVFASAPGAAPDARLTLTSARHGRVRVHQDDNKSVHFTLLLLDKL